jgi:hypothetical protein
MQAVKSHSSIKEMEPLWYRYVNPLSHRKQKNSNEDQEGSASTLEYTGKMVAELSTVSEKSLPCFPQKVCQNKAWLLVAGAPVSLLTGTEFRSWDLKLNSEADVFENSSYIVCTMKSRRGRLK